MITIRDFEKDDWQQCWQIMEPVFRSGETYPYSTQITEEEAYNYWITTPLKSYVAERKLGDKSEIVGTYYIKANQPELGAHVCNCGYLTGEQFRGLGIATKLCQHSQQIALTLGFKAMQFNLVVATNQAAVSLWKKLGFETVGTLYKAFHSQKNGYVDAFVMYKWLEDN